MVTAQKLLLTRQSPDFGDPRVVEQHIQATPALVGQIEHTLNVSCTGNIRLDGRLPKLTGTEFEGTESETGRHGRGIIGDCCWRKQPPESLREHIPWWVQVSYPTDRADVRLGSFATELSQQQVGPCPLCLASDRHATFGTFGPTCSRHSVSVRRIVRHIRGVEQ